MLGLCVFFRIFASGTLNTKEMSESLLLFMNVGPTEIIIIALVVLLLFGGKKIPELMKGLGKGVKSFKEGMNEVTNLEEEEKEQSEK